MNTHFGNRKRPLVKLQKLKTRAVGLIQEAEDQIRTESQPRVARFQDYITAKESRIRRAVVGTSVSMGVVLAVTIVVGVFLLGNGSERPSAPPLPTLQ